ncbi:DsbC family protein [Cupriavidus basilensis]
MATSAALTALAMGAAADESAVRATLAHAFPQSQIQGIDKTPVAGLFEAAIDGQVVYVSADGRYILGGPLIDAKTQVNLTETRLAVINAIPWDRLPLHLAIKRIKGDGTRRIAIFEDPDCPYCKALEQTLSGIDDVTVYVLLYPIDELHPHAADKSKAVWCAKDRVKAWDDIMRTGVAPPNAGTCEVLIAKIAEFAKQHRIFGTPTMILSDGRRLVGAVPRAELENQLHRAAKP